MEKKTAFLKDVNLCCFDVSNKFFFFFLLFLIKILAQVHTVLTRIFIPAQGDISFVFS